MAITKEYVHSIFAKLSSEDSQEFFHHVSDNVSWTVLGTHPLAGHYATKQAFQQATFERLGKLFENGLKLYTHRILLEGNQAAVELYARATSKSGVKFDNDYCWVCRFEGETIVEVRAYLDSALVAKVIEQGD